MKVLVFFFLFLAVFGQEGKNLRDFGVGLLNTAGKVETVKGGPSVGSGLIAANILGVDPQLVAIVGSVKGAVDGATELSQQIQNAIKEGSKPGAIGQLTKKGGKLVTKNLNAVAALALRADALVEAGVQFKDGNIKGGVKGVADAVLGGRGTVDDLKAAVALPPYLQVSMSVVLFFSPSLTVCRRSDQTSTNNLATNCQHWLRGSSWRFSRPIPKIVAS